MSARLVTPGFAEFPRFLKNVESKWKIKLSRRFERERFVANKALGDSKVNKPKPRYILSMFPYPSGRLHLGHVRIYTSADLLTRYSRLMRKNERYEANYDHVINPMGFDSFGLPAENAARERGLNPAAWTNSNIRVMKQQLDDLAIQFDWREATSNPSFYKWTQRMFLKMMDSNLVYKSYAQVNWDPVDKTVLADEQVDSEGKSWRSGAKVEKRYYRQWFIKVNAFTDSIYNADQVDPETWHDVLAIQRNWIGKPSGWLFYLPLKKTSDDFDTLPVFTRNPEFFLSKSARLIISKDHWAEKVHKISQIGQEINPFTGYVMDVSLTDDLERLPQNTKATISLNSDLPLAVDSLDPNLPDFSRDMVLMKAKLHNWGGYYTSDRYRDWLISRQRFWGTPIPVVNCSKCGNQGVNEDSLPVKLPVISNLSLKSRTISCDTDHFRVVPPLEELAPDDWLYVECPSCGSKAKRECETFDTLFDSSWYFLRYASDISHEEPFDRDLVQPVWCYIGGKEHAAMHLFYARFVTHFLNSIGELPFKEPFNHLLVQGVVKSRTYKLDGKYISKSEAESMTNKKKLVVDFEKMSKSKGNGVDPQHLVDTYGIDATRFCLMSYANPRSERLWRTSEEEFREVLSYLRKVTLTVQEYVDIGDILMNRFKKSQIKITELNKDDLNLRKMLLSDARNRCSIGAIFSIQEAFQFRQYISALHVFTSAIRYDLKFSSVYTKEFAEALGSLIVMLNPLVPHLSEELWNHFSQSAINPLKLDPTSLFNVSLQASDQPWPLPDHNYGRSQCVKPLESVNNN